MILLTFNLKFSKILSGTFLYLFNINRGKIYIKGLGKEKLYERYIYAKKGRSYS